MGYGGTPARIIAQNRSLQKSIRSKYNQRLDIPGTDESTIARLQLTELSKQQADNTRKNKLMKKGIIAVVLFIPFAYYAYKWIGRALISF